MSTEEGKVEAGYDRNGDIFPGIDVKTEMVDIEAGILADKTLGEINVGYRLCSFASLNNTEIAENKIIGMLLRHIRFLQEELWSG